jgi:hypothetical protein
MPIRLLAVAIFAGALAVGVRAQTADSRPDLRQLLQQIAGFSPDPCGPPPGTAEDSADLESSIFERTAEGVTEALNDSADEASGPLDRATKALRSVERMSAEVNASWPEEDRFHFEILDLAPALVLKAGIRKRETYLVFGRPESPSPKFSRGWRLVGSPDHPENRAFRTAVSLFPLQRGPSGRARFLAGFTYHGCAGSMGVGYDGREWDPARSVSFEQIIKLEGAFGLDDRVPGFEQIGTLQTKGSLIALPFCWFSQIDTWDNPSLCAVDRYDLSGDTVRFRDRRYNRPELVPVAKAIEHAQARDYPAVLGYCASREVALKLVREIPPYIFADEVRVKATGAGRKRVEMGFESTYRFDVEDRGGRWVVVAFRAE